MIYSEELEAMRRKFQLRVTCLARKRRIIAPDKAIGVQFRVVSGQVLEVKDERQSPLTAEDWQSVNKVFPSGSSRLVDMLREASQTGHADPLDMESSGMRWVEWSQDRNRVNRLFKEAELPFRIMRIHAARVRSSHLNPWVTYFKIVRKLPPAASRRQKGKV